VIVFCSIWSLGLVEGRLKCHGLDSASSSPLFYFCPASCPLVFYSTHRIKFTQDAKLSCNRIGA
jgi:hypothetical protein